MNANKQFDVLSKVIVIGDSGVGKTCLLLRFCDNNFSDSHLATIGIDFKMKIIDCENKKVKVQIWDTAGQDRFKTITESFYKNASGVVLTYAVDDRESFSNVESWMRQVQAKADPNISCVLVGNKSDSENRCVEFAEGKRLADTYGIQFYETSAKEAKNVNDVFYSISKNLLSRVAEMQEKTTEVKPVRRLQLGAGKKTITLNCCQ